VTSTDRYRYRLQGFEDDPGYEEDWEDYPPGGASAGTNRRTVLGAALAGGIVSLAAERLPKLYRWATKGNGGAAANGPTVLGKVADVPVGGGLIFAAHQVVVTQPLAGTLRAFSAVCPHAGCVVDQIRDKKIMCPCHPGLFNIADGSVASGPPLSALPARTISVMGDEVVLMA
jgi:Rieske Fe-S protein